MTLKELVDILQSTLANGASADSPVIIEGVDEEGDLIQRDVDFMTTERRCEDDDEPQGVYLNMAEE